jgi:hypothetical protein
MVNAKRVGEKVLGAALLLGYLWFLWEYVARAY